MGLRESLDKREQERYIERSMFQFKLIISTVLSICVFVCFLAYFSVAFYFALGIFAAYSLHLFNLSKLRSLDVPTFGYVLIFVWDMCMWPGSLFNQMVSHGERRKV